MFEALFLLSYISLQSTGSKSQECVIQEQTVYPAMQQCHSGCLPCLNRYVGLCWTPEMAGRALHKTGDLHYRRNLCQGSISGTCTLCGSEPTGNVAWRHACARYPSSPRRADITGPGSWVDVQRLEARKSEQRSMRQRRGH